MSLSQLTHGLSSAIEQQYSYDMYDHHKQQSMDQPGKVADPARGQLNRENTHFSVPVRA